MLLRRLMNIGMILTVVAMSLVVQACVPKLVQSNPSSQLIRPGSHSGSIDATDANFPASGEIAVSESMNDVDEEVECDIDGVCSSSVDI